MTPTVNAVRPGLVQNWNSTVAPDAQVWAGDRIIEVNGSKDDATEIVRKLKHDHVLNIRAVRPYEVRIYACDDCACRGLSLDYTATGTTLRVLKIGPGPVQRWNCQHPQETISADDRIVQVSTCRGTAEQLMMALQCPGCVDLVFLCYNDTRL
eukprot:NODE_17870_length_922_cov_2.919497.p1 GENE.NODE_17870_length_922_cov_2.919497~~NODE_17870_length_922_cov_2.919497.p1  ORF type:complete len:153 (-),score=30.25 NODE_17870_length_922_cov_2.919497:110-568(-)